MAPELRQRKPKTSVDDEAATKVASKKAAKTSPKVDKRKATEDASPIALKKQKASKGVASKKATTAAEEIPVPNKPKLKRTRSTSEGKPTKKKKVEEEETHENVEDAEEEEEVDTKTTALVKALDSEDETEEQTTISTFKKGQSVGKIPKAKKSSNGPTNSGTPGVMYLGRIPHGFYEHQLREYFGQFGEITKLRVVRNKKTGASRHRAFIEFADAEVADIAARTMDKYLLFGHILTAKIVPPGSVHPELFKGANRRFKAVPWNKMAGRQLERPLSESKWQIKIKKEEEKRAAQAEKLKALGYEFDRPTLKAPEAKPLLENGTEEPKTIEAKALENEAEEPKAIEAAPATEAVSTQAKKVEDKEETQPEAAVTPARTTRATRAKETAGNKKEKAEKTKKSRKSKS